MMVGSPVTNDEFQAWLIGYAQLTGNPPLVERQITIIKNHANLVIEIDGKLSSENQKIIDNLHVGGEVPF